MPDSANAATVDRSAENTSPERRRGRFPAVPAALALAIGITLDRLLIPNATWLWSLAAVIGFVGVVSAFKRQHKLATCLVFVLISVVGALHHHRAWFVQPIDDIEQLLTDERTLIRVRGSVVGFASSIVRDVSLPGRSIPPLTRIMIDVHEVLAGEDWQTANGRLRIDVPQQVQVAPGDGVEATGFAERLSSPRNPGEADYRYFAWAQGVHCTLWVKVPELFKVLPEQHSWFGAARLWLRSKCDAAMREHLKGDSLGIALAFLIGDRSLLTPHVKNAFIETGTMHILAISGVHVTILAGFVVGLCRAFGFSNRSAAIVVLVIATMYLAIADVRPPMLRAFLIIVMAGLATLLRRPGFSVNSLALAGLLVMVLNPTDLFDVGTQLSFLSVSAIVWWNRSGGRVEPASEPDILTPWSVRVRRWLMSALRSMFLLSLLIWAITSPLTVATFHVLSPVSPFINVPLAPLATPALCIGFLFLLVSLMAPPLASPLAWLFDRLLKAMLWCVEFGADIPFGHLYTPAPPLWWLSGIYLGIAAMMLTAIYRRRSRWFVAASTMWALFGVSLAMGYEPSGELRLTVLSVGHGLSVVVETPNGALMVYDVGSNGSGESARRALAETLWQRGRTRIDAVVISHADADHFNGLPAILDEFRVQRLLLNPQFVRSQEPAAKLVLQTIAGRDIELVMAGRSIEIDPDVHLKVLHPQSDQRLESDNATSIVLELSCRGRRFLLTGDLEGSGLREVLHRPVKPVDVMLAPHHGSLNDSPIELVEWAQPDWVVASAGRTTNIRRLKERYGSRTQVLGTATAGAVEFRVSSTGQLTCRTHGAASIREGVERESP
jgi:competence protein ComEC